MYIAGFEANKNNKAAEIFWKIVDKVIFTSYLNLKKPSICNTKNIIKAIFT